MSRFIQLLVIWPDPTHWPIDVPIHPHTHTHPWVGVSLQIINLQTELNYLDSVNNFQIFSVLIWPHPSTPPPTHQTIHPPMGGEVSIDFKSSNRIEISRLVQVLLNFDWFWGSPNGGWGGWMGSVVVRGCTPHTCTCTHMDVWTHREFPGIPPMGAAICIKLCLPCMHVCACTCVHVHVCGGHPPTTPTLIQPTPPPPELQGTQNTKIQ